MRYYKKVLPNGLRLITVPRHDSKAVTILVVFKVGSRLETSRTSGLSHFIEHMMFKGTKRRPTTLDISKELDRVGAEYNAFTTKDHTGYYIKINADQINLAVDIISDILQNSKFEAREMEREKGVILEELNMYEDNPLLYVEDLFEETVFGPKDTLGRLIIGSRKTIRHLTRQQLLKYYHDHYLARRGVVVVAGQITGNLTNQLIKHFSKIKSGTRPEKFPIKKNNQKDLRLTVKQKVTEQIQMCLGFPGLAFNDPKRFALTLLTVILGGNMSSRLFINIREKLGLAYYIKADQNLYEDRGTFYVQAGLDKSRLNQAIKSILIELKKVKDKGVTADELKKAKEFIRGKTILDLEDSASLAPWFGRQEIIGEKTYSPEELYQQIKQVSLSDIKNLAGQLFQKSQLNLVLIGSIEKSVSIKKIINQVF